MQRLAWRQRPALRQIVPGQRRDCRSTARNAANPLPTFPVSAARGLPVHATRYGAWSKKFKFCEPAADAASWRTRGAVRARRRCELSSDDRVTLPKLPWKPDALDPIISTRTIEHHYGAHHRTYVEKTRELVRGSELESLPLEAIVRRAHEQGNKQLFNNAAQAWNHTLYWNSLRPGGGGKPGGALATVVERDFGDVDALRKKWIELAKNQLGSGWVWLVIRSGGRLALEATSNADTPLVRGDVALLTIDVWEHAYYLDWQQRRPEHVTAVLEKLIDWSAAAERYAAVERAVA